MDTKSLSFGTGTRLREPPEKQFHGRHTTQSGRGRQARETARSGKTGTNPETECLRDAGGRSDSGSLAPEKSCHVPFVQTIRERMKAPVRTGGFRSMAGVAITVLLTVFLWREFRLRNPIVDRSDTFRYLTNGLSLWETRHPLSALEPYVDFAAWDRTRRHLRECHALGEGVFEIHGPIWQYARRGHEILPRTRRFSSTGFR